MKEDELGGYVAHTSMKEMGNVFKVTLRQCEQKGPLGIDNSGIQGHVVC
jgi:hypothetical protein